MSVLGQSSMQEHHQAFLSDCCVVVITTVLQTNAIYLAPHDTLPVEGSSASDGRQDHFAHQLQQLRSDSHIEQGPGRQPHRTGPWPPATSNGAVIKAGLMPIGGIGHWGWMSIRGYRALGMDVDRGDKAAVVGGQPSGNK